MSQLLNTAKRHSIVAAYEFDEASGNLLDKIGSNNGTASGTPVYGATDQLGGTEAIEFDGSTDYFTLGSNVLNGASAYTIEVLVYIDSLASAMIVFGERDANDDGVVIQIGAAGTFFCSHNTVDVTTSGITTGQWYHSHLSWDGATLRLYVDGVEVASNSVATAVSTTAAGVIGRNSLGSSFFMNGSIAFVGIYDEALSATDIQELYQAGRLKPSLTLHHDLSASAIDSNLTSYAGRVASNNFSASEVAAIFAADSGSGADVWFSSDASGATPIDAKLLYWSDGDSVFAFDVAIASASSSTGATVYLQVGNKPSGYGTDPYPAAAEAVYGLASDFNDATSNANNGTGNGGIVAGGVTGPDGSVPATAFDGTDDYVGVPDLVTGNSDNTVRAWIKKDSAGAPASELSVYRTSLSSRFYLFIDTSNRLRARIGSGSNFGTATITDTDWHHVALVYDDSAGDAYIYLDGVLVDTDSSASFTATPSFQALGAYSEGSSGYFDGDIADARVATIASSAAEIELDRLLQGPNAATYWTATDISSSDPLGDKSIELGASHVYVFDEASGKLLDRVGSNDGTASGTPTYRESDQRGLPSAIGFDGSTDYFTLTSTPFDAIAAYTVEFVFKLDSLSGTLTILGGRDATNDGPVFYVASSKLRAAHNTVTVSSTTTLVTGQWYHGAATWDGATLKVYVDGVDEASGAVATALSVTRIPTIGRLANATSGYFNGDISHVAIYPRALTATEVGDLYTAGQDTGAATLDPSILKYGMILDDSTLKPGLVNETYTTGTGTSDTLKPGVLDSEGNLKPGLLDADGNIKPGALR